MNIDLTTLPTLPLAQRAALPDAPGIYFALAADGTVLYIGKARRLVVRWSSTQHHRYTQLAAMPGVRLAWLTVEDKALLDGIEAACIEYFAPVLNRSALLRDMANKIKRTHTFDQALLDRLGRSRRGRWCRRARPGKVARSPAIQSANS